MNLLYKSNYKVIILLKYDRVQYFQQLTKITITPIYCRIPSDITTVFLCKLYTFSTIF